MRFQRFLLNSMVQNCTVEAWILNDCFWSKHDEYLKWFLATLTQVSNLLCSQLVPVKPWRQPHIYPVAVSVHVPPFLHGLGEHVLPIPESEKRNHTKCMIKKYLNYSLKIYIFARFSATTANTRLLGGAKGNQVCNVYTCVTTETQKEVVFFF